MGFAQIALSADDSYTLPTLGSESEVGAGMGINVLVVAIGGAIGCCLRYLATLAATRVVGTAFPAGTLLVNIAGCLLAGLVFGLAAERAAFPPVLRMLVMTGFLGGFTTFSAFSLETVNLMRDGSWAIALGSLAANNVIGLAAAVAGIYLGRAI
jgi:CrcB protein